ncbi:MULTISPECIES: hypothetical protein [unclassified Dietzia]|uniref:hypothetical protein n=1 Tax=unclassified Dietzia TaxID=2617939 RepID=UPI0013193FE2|nr:MULTISPECIES: hypothetical protein [unclassified Dietzia]QGW23271.1 hypothetical protein GJR88_00324 [Dietzia sp. DQ12-45-1b]
MEPAPRPAPAAYRRHLFHSRDSVPDQCSDVVWIQGDQYFCDARFSTDAAGATHFRMGFAGELECTDPATGEFEWVHAIAAGEAFGSADIGQLFDVPGWGLLEVGRQLDYVELWQRCADEPGPVWEARGVDDQGTEAVVVCVGDRFGLALGADSAGNRPASVHIGSRTDRGWSARYSSWSVPEPPRFFLSPESDGRFALSWQTGEHGSTSTFFDPIHDAGPIPPARPSHPPRPAHPGADNA